MIEEPTHPSEGEPTACPFVAFEDDRDHRSGRPDHLHRCFAAPEPEPRAFPHQERYCLSAGFTRCPIFLDWARQEAAGIKPADVAGAMAPLPGLGEAGVATAAETGTPAFLTSRTGTTAGADARLASERTGEVAAGLWSYEGNARRTKGPGAPAPPSSLGAQPPANTRRGPTHPGWENPPRIESFPRLRSREERRANQPLLLAALGVALVMVALILFPIVTNSRGGSGASGSVPFGTSAASGSHSPTPTPGVVYERYVVRVNDTLGKIASQHNIEICMILAVNPDNRRLQENPDYLQAGWIINLPEPGQVTCPSPSPSH